jgi:intein/homing endonuclease
MKRWSNGEIKILAENYVKMSRNELLTLLPGRSWKAIRNKATYLSKPRPRRKIDSFFAPRRIGNLSHDDLLYLAGIFDGEGSFVLNRKKGRVYGFAPNVLITNTSKELMEWISKTLGVPYSKFNIGKRGKNWKKAYRISIQRILDIKAFLEQIVPYLKAKERQAKLLLEFCTYQIERKWRETPLRVEEIYQELRILNHKGIRQ